jgi:Adenylosuccinate synthase
MLNPPIYLLGRRNGLNLMIPFLFQVEYVTMKGWKSSIEDVREYDKLPKEAKQYLETIEELVQVPSKSSSSS